MHIVFLFYFFKDLFNDDFCKGVFLKYYSVFSNGIVFILFYLLERWYNFKYRE